MASTRRRLAVIFGLCIAAWLPSSDVMAQPYPSRPVTLVLPLAAGGGADAITRVLAQFLTQEFKQSFVVENRPGANGNIGNAAVARAAPDGYTLLSAYSGIQVTNPSIYEKPGWDPVTDFKPVALMGRAPHVIVAKKDLPVANVKELVAYAKGNPNKLTFASTGIGALSHIGGEQLMQTAGIRMSNICASGIVASRSHKRQLRRLMADASPVTFEERLEVYGFAETIEYTSGVARFIARKQST